MALHSNPRIELSGLQLYVEAADPVCYPGSGQTVYDLSLNNRVLSSNMSESYLNGKVFNFAPDYGSYINIDHNFSNCYHMQFGHRVTRSPTVHYRL